MHSESAEIQFDTINITQYLEAFDTLGTEHRMIIADAYRETGKEDDDDTLILLEQGRLAEAYDNRDNGFAGSA